MAGSTASSLCVVLFVLSAAQSNAAYSCVSGYNKLKGLQATLKCSSAMCTDATCCEADVTKCGGNVVACTGTNYTGKTFDQSATGTNAAECCVIDQAKCSTVSTCAAGLRKKSGTDTMFCGASTCSTNLGSCCEIDPAKCMAVNCGSDKYMAAADSGKTGNDTATCCKDKVKCSTFTAHMSGYVADSTDDNTLINPEYSSGLKSSTCGKLGADTCSVNALQVGMCVGDTYALPAATGNTNAVCCATKPTCANYIATPPSSGATTSAGRKSSNVGWMLEASAILTAVASFSA